LVIGLAIGQNGFRGQIGLIVMGGVAVGGHDA
jgi:hypothetical protein